MEEYTVTFKGSSELAIFVNDGDEDITLPKSQCTAEEDWDEFERGEVITIGVPDWLAQDKGLI